MTFSPVPKPAPREQKPRKWLPRATKPLKRSWLKHGTKPIPKMNRRATERRAVKYRKVLASAFHKELRYVAFTRSNGYCECDECRGLRSGFPVDMTMPANQFAVDLAFAYIPCWFTKKGGADFQRFRSTSGELHHMSYRYFGQENWAELGFVRWVHKICHQRIEAEHHTRRRFLNGKV